MCTDGSRIGRLGADRLRHLRPLDETDSRAPHCHQSHHRTLNRRRQNQNHLHRNHLHRNQNHVHPNLNQRRDVVNRFLWLDTTNGIRESLEF